MYFFPNSCFFNDPLSKFFINEKNIESSEDCENLAKLNKDRPFTLAVNFDLDSCKVSWEIDGKRYEEFSFEYNGKLVYGMLAIFGGTTTIK